MTELVTRDTNGVRYTVAAPFADATDAFLRDLAGAGYKIKSVQGYNNRNIAGTNTLSYHALGAAFDINPDENPVNGGTNMPANVAEIAARHGLGWGGAWTGDKRDPMHFSFANDEGGAHGIDRNGGLAGLRNIRTASAADPDIAAGLTELRRAPTSAGSSSALAQAQAKAPDDDPDLKEGMAALHAAQPTAVAAAKPELKVDPAQMGPLASDVASEVLDNTRKADAAKPVDTRIREALAPDPNTTYGGVLPLAKDNATGALRPALPSSLRDMAQGVYDLSQGPATGTVTPEGTNALAGLVMGGMGASVARGTGGAIGNRLLQQGNPALGRSEVGVAAPAFIPPNAPVPLELAPNRLVAAPQPAALSPPEAPAFIPPKPSEPVPAAQPGMGGGAPAPNSVGAAATPGEATNMSPREAAAIQARAEQYRLANPRTTVNGRDDTQYVPGVKPTTAEITGSTADAGSQKFVANHPDTKPDFRARELANNEARVDYYNDAAGDRQTLANAVAARDAQAERDLAVTWRNKTSADAQPVLDQIDTMLAGPAGKETAVEKALTQVRGKLFDRTGKLETDPELLYGARKEVANLLGKNAQAEQPTLRNAARQLSELKSTLDDQIELSAPGYRQYLSNYAEASRPIDSMQLLQDALPNLQVGTDKNFTFAKFNTFMRGVVDARRAPGANAAKSIDEPTMDRLWNIYSDLHRMDQTNKAGTTAGSPTVPWIAQAGKIAGDATLHGVVGALTGGLGNIPAQMTLNTIKGMRGQNKLAKEANRLLNPTGGSSPQP